MDYYQLGDLEKALRQRRSKGTSLEAQVLYKWLGQMIEALHYVHDQKMIHRLGIEPKISHQISNSKSQGSLWIKRLYMYTITYTVMPSLQGFEAE